MTLAKALSGLPSARSAPSVTTKIDAETVRAGFNDPHVVAHYARAAHALGLWASERALIERWLPDRDAALLEVGCGAGRVALGLWDLGYRRLTAVDFAEELLDQARSLAALRAVADIRFLVADAKQLRRCHPFARVLHALRRDQTHPALSGTPLRRGLRKRPTKSPLPGGVARSTGVSGSKQTDRERPGLGDRAPAAPETCHVIRDKPAEPSGFAGALFLFNGLMQTPGREQRREALREIRAVCRPGAPFLFTTHDRDDDPRYRSYWAGEAARWARGEQDPQLVEFGDRYFQDEHGGYTFMHLPTRAEVQEDLAATGWTPVFDAMRRAIAPESEAVRAFSDECRFWVARRQ